MNTKKRKGGGETWEKGDEILQGVILADSFNFKFLPITLERPRALLPLVNCTLLDYTIEFLVEAGVEEIFVFCCAHADQIVKHLNDSKWMGSRSPCEIHTVIVENCLSTGDALREIDRKSLIRSDFVLVSGDVVSNMKLKHVLNEHKARRQKDKSSIMTMVFKTANPGHRTRCREDDTVLALDSSTNRVLFYERTIKRKKFEFPLTLFADNHNIQLRYDLLDCHICICSTQVPHLFTDNFDYQTRQDFIKGILINEDILGNQIHCNIINDTYAARVSNFYMYDAVSKDILHRWSYPIVPDNSSFFMEDSYSYIRHNLYLDKDLSLARDCELKENLIIGCGTSVGTGTVLSNCVIGKNCTIGDNVTIQGAHLWDNVVVESNCIISDSILCSGAHIKKDVSITTGSLVSFNVVIGPDIKLKPRSRVTLKQKQDDEGDFGMEDLSLEDKQETQEPPGFNAEDVGEEGQGYLWLHSDDIDSDDDDENRELDLWGEERESSSEDEVSSISSEESLEPESPPPEDSSLFYNEVLETIRHGVADKVSPDNMVLEINASKFAYNVTFRDVNQSMVKALLETSLPDNTMDKRSQAKSLKKTLDHLKPLMEKYIRDADGQKDLIIYAEEFFALNKWCNAMLQIYLNHLYNVDLLEETVILSWHANPGVHDDHVVESQKKLLRERVLPFIKWLKEAEEESEDEDEDDD
ncbi:translation initiation factor eIF-2B subunit epsilon-like [Actinia tenebrosa]|uniref:Translation initiation factor eIF2B subunit epsilon n=1 Tax=Actinia tenebrosa TaxID=6105 RepID=A0A6P8J4P5_ACTTE|nr:translation initiation factor eIF-2B subunit epsilon-like [Actinia tenebrosa]